MKKLMFLVLIITFLLTGCGKEKSEPSNSLVNENELKSAVYNGLYYPHIYYYDENNNLKEYYQYTNQYDDLWLKDNQECNMTSEVSHLLLGHGISRCSWVYQGDTIILNYEYTEKWEEKTGSLKAKIDGYDLFIETEVFDNNYGKWDFEEVNIAGVRFEPFKYHNFESNSTPVSLKVNEDVLLYVDSEIKLYSFEVGKHKDITDLFNVSNGYIKGYDGELNFNKTGKYPIKINYQDNEGFSYSRNVIIAIVPSMKEQDAWFKKHYGFHTPMFDESQYYTFSDNNERSVCVNLYNEVFIILVLKNGAKCENYYSDTYGHPIYTDEGGPYLEGKWVTYEIVKKKTSTLGEIYKFFNENHK